MENLLNHEISSIVDNSVNNHMKYLYIESYGCQMNVSDSEIVVSILSNYGYMQTQSIEKADLILLNTCSVREKAEQTIYNRLSQFSSLKKNKNGLIIGILGCMAERLKEKLLEEHLVDIVVGPDSYKELPHLLIEVKDGKNAINVILSKEETYADINPVRISGDGVFAFVTIMRGCDNMCTFCVVPFTRGRERSRDPYSIIKECKDLEGKGYKEITLLGQNVDSYLWYGGGAKKDFDKIDEIRKMTAIRFSNLLDMVAKEVPNMRIRFSTSNPQDMSEEVLYVMKENSNICKYIHLPVQSGSSSVLQRMNRRHTRGEYIALINKIREIIPDCAISHDIISGFCGETEEEHQETLSLMKYVNYDFGYMFAYSGRPGTLAYNKMKDDVPIEIKKRRLNEIISLQNKLSLQRMKTYVGNEYIVLIEGNSKKSSEEWYGRMSQNAVVVFPKVAGTKKGDFVKVYIEDCTQATLKGKMLIK